MAKSRVVKLCIQVGYVKFQNIRMTNKPVNGRGQANVTQFKV